MPSLLRNSKKRVIPLWERCEMQTLRQHLASLSSTSNSQQEALEKLQTLPLPSKKTEAYRYFDIEKVLQTPYKKVQKQNEPIKEGGILEIVDGIVMQAPKSVKVDYKKERPLAKEHFDPLYYASHALVENVITILVNEDTELKLLHRFERKNALLAYRIVFECDDNVCAKISESFIGCDAAGSLILYGYDLLVGRDAQVEIVKDETLTQGTYTPIYSNYVHLEKNAKAKLFTFDFGDASGLQLVDATIGEEAHLEAKHLLYAKNTAKRGTVARLVHADKNASSKQVAKNILQDSSRGIFDAKIEIQPTAAGAKAHQNSKAILLNDGAYMASKPQLVINIDDVEASHGSTIGELDEDQLFYLRSRGIAKEEARKLLILAFANEIIDDISDEKVLQGVHLSFEKVYYGQGRLECIATCHHCEETILGEKR